MTTMNAAQLIAVPDLNGESAGSIVWWRLSGDINLAALAVEWQKAGLDAGYLPDPTSPEVALRLSVRKLRAPRRLVRHLGDDGWGIVDETATGRDLTYDVNCRAYLDTWAKVDPPNHPLAPAIIEGFEQRLNTLSQKAISAWLCWLVDRTGAVKLRDTGGIYFIPKYHLPTWHAVVAATKVASSHTFFEVPALKSDQAVEAILDALVREAEQAAADMETELAEGDLGAKGLRTRQDRCQAAKKKLGDYEKLLGVNLGKMKEKLDALNEDLVAAALAAEEKEDEK